MLVGAWAIRNRNRANVPNSQPTSGQVVDKDQPPTDGGQPDTDSPTGQETPAADKQQAVALTQQAGQAMQKEQYNRAANLYEQAIAADPHHLPAYYGLSEALRQSGHPDASVAALEEAVANNPNQVGPLIRLGDAQLFTAEAPEAALETFEQAAALEPDEPTPYAGQALALLFLDREEEAKAAIDTALNLDQTNAEARLANAAYLAKQGNRQEALQEIQNIMQDRDTPFLVRERARFILTRLRN